MECRRTVTTMLLVATFSGAAHGQPKTKSPGEEAGASLKGIWSAVSVENGGQKSPSSQVKALRFVFARDKLTMRMIEQVISETEYTTDPTTQPPTIRLTYEGKPTLGIYKLDGDDLTICLSPSAAERPNKFASEADSPNRLLIVLKRGDLGPSGWPLLVIGGDGGGLRPLAELPKDMAVGSPDWSPDGNKVAFDAWRLARGENYGHAHVYVVGTDGTGLTDVAVGAMPSWSHDGKKMTFCQYGPRRGVWIMSADGSNQQLIDASGWGSDWSPKGNEIAYTLSSGVANICIVNPDTGERRTILETQQYQSIYWNLSWSPDAEHICFKGVRPDGEGQIAIVSTQGDDKGFKVLLSAEGDPKYEAIRPIVAWDGNAEQILVSMKGAGDRYRQLYILDPQGKSPPKHFPGQNADRDNGDMAWSSDGKTLVFASHKPE